MIDGFAVVDKPAGLTSHDVVARCRKRFGQKRVGHAGTLDPDATGVLVLGLGRATRLLRFASGLDKAYTGEIVLGVATSTLDAAGEVTGRWDQTRITLETARRAAAGLTGPIRQRPPMVSAVKVGGRRLHELARQGIEVERAERPVTVHRFDLDLSANPALVGEPGQPRPGPVLRAAVECSSGTYVRVLAADLGTVLGGGAHVRALRRTAVGPWTDADAVPLDDLDESRVIPMGRALPWLEHVAVGADTAALVGNGRVLGRDELGGAGPGPWCVVGPDGGLLAVYEPHGADRVKPTVVVALSDAGGE